VSRRIFISNLKSARYSEIDDPEGFALSGLFCVPGMFGSLEVMG
jgi:hypothetical protein